MWDHTYRHTYKSLRYILYKQTYAAVLTVVLQKISEDTVIFAELVHLKEPLTSLGSGLTMDYVRRAVRGMLYADDACIVSRSPQGLAKTMKVIVEVCRAYVSTVSEKKIETVCMPPPRTMMRVSTTGQT